MVYSVHKCRSAMPNGGMVEIIYTQLFVVEQPARRFKIGGAWGGVIASRSYPCHAPCEHILKFLQAIALDILVAGDGETPIIRLLLKF